MHQLIITLIIGGFISILGQENGPNSYVLTLNSIVEPEDPRILCSAILLAPNWALTTAYAVYSVRVDLLSVSADNLTVTSLVDSVFMHPNYSVSNDYDSDIALLKLSSPLDCANCIPIESLSSATPKGGDIVTVSGWGYNNITFLPQELMSVNVAVVDRDECNDIYADYAPVISKNSFCAENYFSDDSHAIYFQTGGAVTLNKALVGVITQDEGYNMPDLPGIYADVASFVKWIDDTMKSK